LCVCVCVCVGVVCVCVCVYELPFCPCAVPFLTFYRLTASVTHNINVVTPVGPREASVSYILIPNISKNNITEVEICKFSSYVSVV